MKKGFTLIEMAVVLAVVALLFGMVMKGRALVEAAQIKSEVHKIEKLLSAFSQYRAKYNVDPGRSNIGSVIGNTTAAIYTNLLEGGYLTDADFKVSAIKNAYWNFTGCSNGDIDGYWRTVELKSVSNICAYVSFIHPKEVNREMTNITEIDAYSLKFICYIESIIDDKDTLKGAGRSAYHYVLNIPDYNKCNKLSDEPTLSYLYKVN